MSKKMTASCTWQKIADPTYQGPFEYRNNREETSYKWTSSVILTLTWRFVIDLF